MAGSLRASAAALGSRGGRAGSGASKRRGDSEYYRRLAARRKDRASAQTGMRHRHLTHRGFTLASIDDIVSNGRWDAWVRLRRALYAQPGIREKILKVCDARVHEPSAQRHRFWKQYAQDASAAP
jgi:hypothetical protein